MPASTSYQLPSSTTTAQLRAWTTALSDGIVTAGAVRTTDTGQTLPSALVASVALDVLLGYEIFRFADALQATAPVFFRVEYRNHNTVGSPVVRVNVGTGTDGAGNLISVAPHYNTVMTPQHALQNLSYTFLNLTTETRLLIVNGDGSSLLAVLFPHTVTTNSTISNCGGGFLIERTRDADGAPNGRGVLFMTWQSHSGAPSGTTTAETRIFNSLSQQIGAVGSGWATGSPHATSLEGGVVYPTPVYTGYTPRLNSYSKFLMAAGRSDLPFATTYPLSLYGETHTWLSYGPGWVSSSGAPSGYGNIGGSAITSPQVRITRWQLPPAQ